MKILIVDDDIVSLQILQQIFEKTGYKVVKATNGVEAISILQQKDCPSLVVLDWMMPEMDGLEVCRRARLIPRLSPLYIILLTARNARRDIVLGLEAGADDYLTKPFNQAELYARVRIGEKVVGLQNSLLKRVEELEEALRARRQVEAEMALTEEYQKLFKHAKDALIIFDPESMRVLDVNDKACETYSIAREAFVGQFLMEKFLSNIEKFLLLIKGEVVEEFESVYRRDDNTLLYFLTNLSIIEYKNKQAILVISRDISKQKWVEWKILRAEEEWKETVDAISDIIIIEDTQFRLQRCNKATINFFNTSFSQLVGQKISDLFPYSQKGTIFIHDPLHKTSGAALETQFPGKNDWFEVTKHPLPQEMGGCVYIIKNVTDRKLSEMEMERLKTGIEQAADAVSITNSAQIIQYVNPSFQQISGWSKTESIGRNFLELQCFSSPDTYVEITNALLRGQIWNGNYEAKTKDGTIYCAEATISPVKNEIGEIVNFVAVSRNVSEKKRLESIAEAINMTENVGYVFSGIRHELGNPINSLKTALAVLRKNVEQWSQDKIINFIDRAMVEISRVEYLLKSLKTLTMYEDIEVKKVQINEFMEKFLSFVKRDFTKKGIKIEYSINPEVNECMADTRALHQILLNILSNAFDAVENKEDPLITVAINKIVSNIEINITDNGIGLSQMQQAKLFKPFNTSKPKGTGLGLVIVKKMMANMNGTIKIESQLNVGTKVILSLEAS